MNNELNTLIIKELRKHRSRNDIVNKICERGSLTRKQAEQLLILVEARHKRLLVPSASPVLLLLSIGVLILGIGLMAFNLQIVLAFLNAELARQVLSLQGASYRLIGLVTGFGMSIGGLAGLWKAFGAIFPE